MPADPISPTRDSVVTLREITRETLRPILDLSVTEAQREMVAANARSIAEAHFEELAWFRGVYADDTPVGFVQTIESQPRAFYYLWRFMIDQRFQGLGFGRGALTQIIDRIRYLPEAKEIVLTYVPTEGGPQPFYQKNGFRDTGMEHDGELEMKLVF